jgi:hypothetical protein
MTGDRRPANDQRRMDAIGIIGAIIFTAIIAEYRRVGVKIL